MKELFDLDYLGKDLTGNAEIQASVDRVLAFMKLEKWDKALDICEELIDLHPESPCSWFAKARLVTRDFTFFGLSKNSEGRMLVAQAADCLTSAIKVVEDERAEEYKRLHNTYSDYLKKDFADYYTSKFIELIDSYENLVKVAKLASHTLDYQMFMICEAFSKCSANADGGFDENTFYGIPVEIINEIGTVYPSVRLASLHILLLVEMMKPYFAAQEKQAHAKRVQEARFEQRKGWNSRQGFGYSLDAGEIASLSKECPVYELHCYYDYKLETDWTLSKLIKDNSVFDNVPGDDERVKDVLKAYFKFFKIIQRPIGDLKSAGITESYMKDLEPIIKEMEVQQAKEAELQAKEAEERKKKEQEIKEKKEVLEKSRKSANIKSYITLIVGIYVIFFSFSIIGSGLIIPGGILLVVGIVLVVIFIKRKKKLN